MELGAGSKGERAAARANELDEVIKVRQESTRDDAISTAGPRVMARRGRVEGARCGATMPQIERQQRVQHRECSAAAVQTTAAVFQRIRVLCT